MKKHLTWATALVIIVIIISGTLIWINYNSWTLRFEMDENTKKAIESIEWEEINRDGFNWNTIKYNDSDMIFNPNNINKNCTPIPCECHKWGCALYCMECLEEVNEAP